MGTKTKTRTRSWSWGARVRRGGLVVGLVLGTGSQLGFSCEAACSEPYRPVGGDEVSVGQPPSGRWPVPATAVARPPVTPPLDTDGDGVPDTVEGRDEGRTLVIHRTSGDLALTVAAPAQIATDVPEILAAGDVDADGRDDMVVTVLTSDPPAATIRYLVSGATANGTHPVEDVAATLLPAGDARRTFPVGDLDGDGHDDLAAVVFGSEVPESSAVWPGADLPLTAGTVAPAPALHPPGGSLLGAVPLDGRSALVIVTHRADGDRRYHEFEVWIPGAGMTFTTAGAGPIATVQPIGGGTAPAQFRILDDPGPSGDGHDRWLTATLQNRGQTQRWAWDLDDLCANTPATA